MLVSWKHVVAVLATGISISGGPLVAQGAPVKNIVLVHGAFADGQVGRK